MHVRIFKMCSLIILLKEHRKDRISTYYNSLDTVKKKTNRNCSLDIVETIITWILFREPRIVYRKYQKYHKLDIVTN